MLTALEFLLDNIFVRFGDIVYRKFIGILMGTNCAPLNADRPLSVSMTRMNKDPSKQQLIKKFNNTFRYLDEFFILNIL